MTYVCVIDVLAAGEPILTNNSSFVNGEIKIYCGIQLRSDSDSPPTYMIVKGQTHRFVLQAIYTIDKEYEEDCSSSSSVTIRTKTNPSPTDIQYAHFMAHYMQNQTSRRCIFEGQTAGQREIILSIQHPNALLMNMHYSCHGFWTPNNYNNYEVFHKTSGNMYAGLIWPISTSTNQYYIGAPTLSSNLNNNETSLILKCPIQFSMTNIFQWGVSMLPHTPIIPIRLIQMSKNSDETSFPSLQKTTRLNSPPSNIKVQEGEFFGRNSLQIGNYDNNNTDMTYENPTMCFFSTEYAKSLYPIEGEQNCFKLLSFAYSPPNRTNVNQHSFYNLTYLLHNKILDFDGQSIGDDDDNEFNISLSRYNVKNVLFQLPSLFYMRSILLNPRGLSPNTVGGRKVNDKPLYIHPTIDIYKDFMAFLMRWTRQYETMKIKWAKRSFINLNDISIDYVLTYKCTGRILLIASNDSRCTFTQPHWLKEQPLFKTTSNYSVVGIFTPYHEVDVLVNLPYGYFFSNNTISFCSWQKYLCFEGRADYSNTIMQLIEPSPWEMESKYYSNLYKGFNNEWTVSKEFRETHPIFEVESTEFLNKLSQMHHFLKDLPFISNLIPLSNYQDANNVCPCRSILTRSRPRLMRNSTFQLQLSPNQFDPTDKFYCNIFYDTTSVKPLNLWEALEDFMCTQMENIPLSTIKTRISNYQPKLYIEKVFTNLTHVSYVCRNVFTQCLDLAAIDSYVYYHFDNNTIHVAVSKDFSTTIIGLNQTFDVNFTALSLPLNYSIGPYEFNHMLIVPKHYVDVNCQHMTQTSTNEIPIPGNFPEKNLESSIPCTLYDIQAKRRNQCIICSITVSTECHTKPIPRYNFISSGDNLTCSQASNIQFIGINKTDKGHTNKLQNSLYFYCHEDPKTNTTSAVICAGNNSTDNITDSIPNNTTCATQLADDKDIILSHELGPYDPQCLPLPLYIHPETSTQKSNNTHLNIDCLLPKWLTLPICSKHSMNIWLYAQSINTPQLIANKMGNLCNTYPLKGISCTINNDNFNSTLFTFHISRESNYWHNILGLIPDITQLQCVNYEKKRFLHSSWKTVQLSSIDKILNITTTAACETRTTSVGLSYMHVPFYHPDSHIKKKYFYLVFASIYLIILCIPVIIIAYIIKSRQNIIIQHSFQ